jgi:hypothetical protein
MQDSASQARQYRRRNVAKRMTADSRIDRTGLVHARVSLAAAAGSGPQGPLPLGWVGYQLGAPGCQFAFVALRAPRLNMVVWRGRATKWWIEVDGRCRLTKHSFLLARAKHSPFPCNSRLSTLQAEPEKSNIDTN